MGCCEVLKSIFSVVKGIVLLVLLWNFYLYLNNGNDITGWFKHVMYGIIVLTSMLILVSMVCDVCCCATNKNDDEEDLPQDRDASKGCCKVISRLVQDVFLLGFLWKYYSHLSNADDVSDWFKNLMYGLIIVMSILILYSMICDLCCCSTNIKKEEEVDASKYYSSENSEVIIDIISDLP